MKATFISDMDLQALVDGEVDEERSAFILEQVTRDPTLYNRYLLYKKQKNLLKSWWKDN